MLTLKEAIDVLECGDWVALRFITADVKQGSGGKVIELAKCRIARNREGIAHSTKATNSGTAITRNPNHAYNFTRNVELPNKSLRKVHPILITHINHIAVL